MGSLEQNATSSQSMAVQGCMRQALRIFLVSDEVEVDGIHGRIEHLHEDRTCTVSLFGPGAAQPPHSHTEHIGCAQECLPSVLAVEVRAGLLIDQLSFVLRNGDRRSYGDSGGSFAGRFDLEEADFICRITGTCGDSLDSVQFHTSFGRASQIFGNPQGGRPFELAAASGQEVVGVRRGSACCGALRGLICASLQAPSIGVGQRVRLQGLLSAEGRLLNGRDGIIKSISSAGRYMVCLSGDQSLKSIKEDNLQILRQTSDVRKLLRDCELLKPVGNFRRHIKQEHDSEVVAWTGRCDLHSSGRAMVRGARGQPTVGREGVHHVLRVAQSHPLPQGARVTAVELQVYGMDQGWGNTGDSGVVLYIRRTGSDFAATLEQEDPLLKITYDRRRQTSLQHRAQLDGLNGPMAPQPGDIFEVTLHCPNYPGWSAFVERASVRIHCVTEAEEVLPGSLPEGWEANGPEAFERLWKGLREDAMLAVDDSHLSLQGQALQRVWSQNDVELDHRSSMPPLRPRLEAICKRNGHEAAGALRLLGKLDDNAPTAGAPQDPERRRLRYRALASLVHSTLDTLERGSELKGTESGGSSSSSSSSSSSRNNSSPHKSSFLETLCTHYADAADLCVYRWERELANMHDLVTGDSVGEDALTCEDALLRLLCKHRRQLAEAALHQAKGNAGNSDMHFESYFFGSIHFGLPEQLEAAKDPNRLNYASLGMLRPAEVQRELRETYTPAAIRNLIRKEVLDSAAPGSQALREKLLDWLRSHVPCGFRPSKAETGGITSSVSETVEAWIYECCHDEHYQLRDEALNFILCGVHVLKADRLACLAGAGIDDISLGSSSEPAPAHLFSPRNSGQAASGCIAQ